MKILINLSSILLGKALQELLEREPEGYRAFAVSDVMKNDGFRPDFIVVDSCTIRRSIPLLEPDVKIVLLDGCLSDQEMTSLLLSCKIDAVLAITTDLCLFKKALNAVRAGQIWIDNHKIKALVHHTEFAKTPSQDESFSRKEREIIILVSQGLTNRAIAAKLGVSEQTVKTHLGRIFRKSRVSRRSQLVPLAMKLRIPDTV